MLGVTLVYYCLYFSTPVLLSVYLQGHWYTCCGWHCVCVTVYSRNGSIIIGMFLLAPWCETWLSPRWFGLCLLVYLKALTLHFHLFWWIQNLPIKLVWWLYQSIFSKSSVNITIFCQLCRLFMTAVAGSINGCLPPPAVVWLTPAWVLTIEDGQWLSVIYSKNWLLLMQIDKSLKMRVIPSLIVLYLTILPTFFFQ